MPTIRSPREPDRLSAAQALVSAGRHDDALRLLQPALDDAAQRPEAMYLLAVAALMTQRVDAAVRHARAAVDERPVVARYHFVLGRALKAADDRAGAAAAYERALQLEPGHAEAMVSLGIVRKDQGDIDAAIELYERALRRNPGLAAAHANRALALALRAERSARAGADVEPSAEVLDAQGRAVALDLRNPVLHRNYGTLLRQARRYPEAMAAFNEALTLDPGDEACCLVLGATLGDVGAVALESQCYVKWLAGNPPSLPVMRALSGSQTLLGEADSALDWAQKALALDADPTCLMQAANVLQQLRRVDESLVLSRKALDDSGRLPALYPPHLLGMNYTHEEEAPVAAAHEEFGARFPPSARRAARPEKASGERLRIGYVSGDFVRHSVSFFIEPLLEHHDTSGFEIVCYHNRARSDHVTERLKAHGHRWVECAGLSDAALARRIEADGIDILIDLAGPTAHSRLLMFALAPAPVQVSYLGYPTRSGMPTIDFRLTDRAIDPEDGPAFASERPLHLASTMFCFRPDAAPPIVPPPSAAGGGRITFGSFNNTAKVTDRTLALWAQVLHAVPTSRLVLKAASMAQGSVQAGILAFMAARGIEPGRLDLHSRRAGDMDHLSLYNEIDIALDTYPYNGATTTCEALWMGLPVVTRCGQTRVSRMGASLLGAIGRAGWVARTDADYVAIAVALASDPGALGAWRAGARDWLRSSPLLAQAGFTRRFEAALRQAWALRGHRQDGSGSSA